MALLDRARSLLDLLTVPTIDVEVNDAPPQTASFNARDIDPNELRGGGAAGSRYGALWRSTSAMVNIFTGQGTSRDPSAFNMWAVPRYLGRIERHGMGRNALVQQALGKLPNSATREGWYTEILAKGIEEPQAVSELITAYEQRLAIVNRINRALFRGRQHAQAMVILGIDDNRPLSEPVDVENIRTIRWAVTIDKRDFNVYKLAPGTSEHFGGVELFEVTNLNGILEDGLRYGEGSASYDYSTWESALANEETGGQVLVHADRVLYFPTGDYYSLLDSLQDSLGAFFEVMHGIRTAARESSLLKYKVQNNKWQQWSSNSRLAKEHMRVVNLAKSAMNAFVLGDGDDVSNLARPLAGLADLANPIMAWVAAALSIPNTIFWQVSPGGFGKGEAERDTFHEDVHAFQEQILTPQLTRLHGYILAAQDGARLPADTRRKIVYNDLTPPDEQVRTELRDAALERLEAQFESNLITRNEAREAAAKLADEYYQLKLDEEFVEKPPPAQVGIFTGSIELLTQLYGEGNIPLDSARALLVALDPVHYNVENVRRIIPDPPAEESALVAAPTSSTVTGGNSLAPASSVPGDEEDGTQGPSEVDLAWRKVERPPNAKTAAEIAEDAQLSAEGVTKTQIKALARHHGLKAYPPKGYSSEPTFLLEEVKQALLRKHGHLPPAEVDAPASEAEALDVRDISADSLCVMLELPRELARFVPYKAEDTSPPHITLVFAKRVPQAKLETVVAALRETFATFDPFDVRVVGKPVHYFDTEKGRVAYALAEFHEQDLVFDELAFAVERALLGEARAHVVRHDSCRPHVTLAYLSDDEGVYVGPSPDGSWRAESARVTYGGEPVAVLPFEGRELAFADDDYDAAAEDGELARAADKGPLIQEGWIWRTQKDDRVRPSHRKLNGRRFKHGDKDPIHGEPGDDPNCRCAKEIIVPPGGTKRARAAAKRTTKRALERRYKKITGAALKRQGDEAEHDYEDALAFCEAEDTAFEKSVADMTEEARKKYIDRAFKRYQEETNMGAEELERWSKTAWSKKASLSREPITRNLRLKRKPKSEWTLADARGAMRTVNFNSRMRGNSRGKPLKIDGREGPSKRDASLKNWAWNPSK